jgi:hypothetical protein
MKTTTNEFDVGANVRSVAWSDEMCDAKSYFFSGWELFGCDVNGRFDLWLMDGHGRMSGRARAKKSEESLKGKVVYFIFEGKSIIEIHMKNPPAQQTTKKPQDNIQ